jgi:general stress protein 26
LASDGIVFIFVSADAPFEAGEKVVIVGVQDCPLAFVEVNSAIGAADAEQAISEQWTGENKV